MAPRSCFVNLVQLEQKATSISCFLRVSSMGFRLDGSALGGIFSPGGVRMRRLTRCSHNYLPLSLPVHPVIPENISFVVSHKGLGCEGVS